MKIAIVSGPMKRTPPVATGPYELFTSELTEGLVARGHDVTLFGSGDSITTASLKSLYPVSLNQLAMDSPELQGEGLAMLEAQYLSWVLARIRDLRPDVVHTQWPHFIPLMAGMDPTLPHVSTHHHFWLDDTHVKVALAGLFKFIDAKRLHLVALAKFQKAYYPSSVTMHVVPHGLNYTPFVVGTAARTYLLSLGRITASKGTHIAIDVAKKAGLPLVIAGTIDGEDYYREQVAPHVDGTNVRYVGEANFPQKVELFGGAIAQLFPIQWDEPFGLTQIESMACGTPVVGFRRGAVPDVVRDGVSGYVVDSVDQMVQRIPDAAKLAPASVRQYVEENFSLSRMVDGYEAVYRAATLT